MSDDRKVPKWTEKLFNVIEKYWTHHGPCNNINFHVEYSEESRYWNVLVAPVFQEIFGGENDGKKVWTGFIFEASNFSKVTGIEIHDWAIASFCEHCSPCPKLMLKGKYKGHKILMQILLEPPKETDAVEILDVVAQEVRNKTE